MAYFYQPSSLQRGPILVAIAALQAGVIYALVSGLQVIIPPPEVKPPLAGEQIPLPKIEKPMRAYPDETMPTPRSPRSEASQELVPPRVKPTSGVETGEDRNEVDLGSIVAPILQPHPPVAEPSFAPKVARPLGSPGHWVTSDDYPARSLRERQEGLSRFRLTIGADGSIRDCTITASSGHAELDQATCAKLTRRGKFNAATDGSGKSVAGSYSGAVRWKLPRDY